MLEWNWLYYLLDGRHASVLKSRTGILPVTLVLKTGRMPVLLFQRALGLRRRSFSEGVRSSATHFCDLANRLS